MVVGFNHNIRYKGELFHVQTEDSGRSNPHIITLLYRGGTILASAKTSYADILTTEQLELVVESIMKEQHKDMMRRLKGGEFDAKIFPNGAPAATQHATAPAPAAQSAAAPARPAPAAPAATTATATPAPGAAASTVTAASASAAPKTSATPSPASTAATKAAAPATTHMGNPAPRAAAAASPASKETPASAPSAAPASTAKRSLDEVILDYLITGEE